jgi:phenylpropionate dioxygenase-like ring-hydroxylating dioxygenase large terminal subunit
MRKSIVEKPSSVEDILETGLLNNWYLVARDSEIGNKPVGLKRLNRDIVVWRDKTGEVHAVEDFCPHRGARLSLGHVCDGNVACAYHGLQVDGNGVIATTPPTPNSPLVGMKAITAYPCQERHGAIWVYFADESHQGPLPELRFPDEFESGEWCGFVDIRQFECNYQLVRDNQLDPVHGSYLHAGTHALFGGRKDADMGFEKTDLGFVVWRKNQQGVNLDRTWVQRYEGCNFWAITDLPYPPHEGGGMVRLFRFPTPIDRENTLVWNYRLLKATGWRRDLWRFLYKNRVHFRGAEVLEQDRVALSQIPVDALQRENLLQCDIGVARIRRRYREEAERQFRAMTAGAAAAE